MPRIVASVPDYGWPAWRPDGSSIAPRARNPLPEGTMPVGLGLVISGHRHLRVPVDHQAGPRRGPLRPRQPAVVPHLHPGAGLLPARRAGGRAGPGPPAGAGPGRPAGGRAGRHPRGHPAGRHHHRDAGHQPAAGHAPLRRQLVAVRRPPRGLLVLRPGPPHPRHLVGDGPVQRLRDADGQRRRDPDGPRHRPRRRRREGRRAVRAPDRAARPGRGGGLPAGPAPHPRTGAGGVVERAHAQPRLVAGRLGVRRRPPERRADRRQPAADLRRRQRPGHPAVDGRHHRPGAAVPVPGRPGGAAAQAGPPRRPRRPRRLRAGLPQAAPAGARRRRTGRRRRLRPRADRGASSSSTPS